MVNREEVGFQYLSGWQVAIGGRRVTVDFLLPTANCKLPIGIVLMKVHTGAVNITIIASYSIFLKKINGLIFAFWEAIFAACPDEIVMTLQLRKAAGVKLIRHAKVNQSAGICTPGNRFQALLL